MSQLVHVIQDFILPKLASQRSFSIKIGKKVVPLSEDLQEIIHDVTFWSASIHEDPLTHMKLIEAQSLSESEQIQR